MKKYKIIPFVLLFSGIIYISFLIFRHESNYEIYRQFIKWDSRYFDLIHTNKPLNVSDSTFNLEEMEAYKIDGDLINQNPNSLYCEIKRVFPDIDLATINDFYINNKVKTVLNTKPLSLSIKARNFLMSNKEDTINVHFSQLGFNSDNLQAMVYVHHSEENFIDNSMYFYKKKFGLWFKETQINVSSMLIQPRIMNGAVPPLPPSMDSIINQ
jgi:hypothetical protein